MEYKDVRLFMKKGAEAIEILEGLGYEWGSYQKAPPKWEKVKADPLQPVYDAVGKLMDDLQAPLLKRIEEMTEAARVKLPMEAGDYFRINPELIALQHKLKREVPHWNGAIFKARLVESASPHGPIVRFGPPDSFLNQGYWLPLEATIKL